MLSPPLAKTEADSHFASAKCPGCIGAAGALRICGAGVSPAAGPLCRRDACTTKEANFRFRRRNCIIGARDLCIPAGAAENCSEWLPGNADEALPRWRFGLVWGAAREIRATGDIDRD